LERGLWTIAAERMKASKDHRVALSDPTLAVLKATPCLAGTDLIWPGQGLSKPMSDATVAALVKKMHAAEVKDGREGWLDPVSGRPATPHGFRSTFRVWAAEQTSHPYEMIEMALAHSVGTAVERAYNRTDMVEKRRVLMEDWAEFIFSEADR
jgi:integrase